MKEAGEDSVRKDNNEVSLRRKEWSTVLTDIEKSSGIRSVIHAVVLIAQRQLLT